MSASNYLIRSRWLGKYASHWCHKVGIAPRPRPVNTLSMHKHQGPHNYQYQALEPGSTRAGTECDKFDPDSASIQSKPKLVDLITYIFYCIYMPFNRALP
jgi:hypothetical protein